MHTFVNVQLSTISDWLVKSLLCDHYTTGKWQVQGKICACPVSMNGHGIFRDGEGTNESGTGTNGDAYPMWIAIPVDRPHNWECWSCIILLSVYSPLEMMVC